MTRPFFKGWLMGGDLFCSLLSYCHKEEGWIIPLLFWRPYYIISKGYLKGHTISHWGQVCSQWINSIGTTISKRDRTTVLSFWGGRGASIWWGRPVRMNHWGILYSMDKLYRMVDLKSMRTTCKGYLLENIVTNRKPYREGWVSLVSFWCLTNGAQKKGTTVVLFWSDCLSDNWITLVIV